MTTSPTVNHLDQIEFATFEKTLLVALPSVLMAAMQTQMISASITAYSTAVGPSSEIRNRRNLNMNDFMVTPIR